MRRLSESCRKLYYGTSEASARGRFIILAVDCVIIAYFLATTFYQINEVIRWIDIGIGVYLSLELIGRILADTDRLGLLSKPLALLDIAIIISLFAPELLGSGTFAFLRVVRAMRLLRSYTVTRELKQNFRFFARNEEIIFSALNLMVFIFVITAFVFVLQEGLPESQIENYADALYFTVTTLTTTGFGDVILVGQHGRVLAIIIMIVGVALFLRLLQTVFRPSKIRYECPQCGLTRHDLDAVHCKHCGHELHIRTEGLY
jgi:voltage-gated potassium channel